MNILIKLMSIVSLVIAPYISVGGSNANEMKGDCCKEQMEMDCCKDSGAMMSGKCDMRKCATMTKEQCAAMCDSMGCDSAEKAMCMSMYNAEGKFIGKAGAACCQGMDADHCKMDKDKCAKGDACCKNKAAMGHGHQGCANENAGSTEPKKACCKDHK